MKAFALGILLAAALPAQQNLEQFFKQFTDEWVRGNPDQATDLRYFEGEEADRLARQLTPLTKEYQLKRIALARQGMEQLAKFDRSEMSDDERLSADMMQWQLQAVVDEEPYLDYNFPLNQFTGANVGLVSVLTDTHTIATERDAENYVARLAQMPTRLNEAIERAREIEKKGILPPKFILDATAQQIERFSDPSPRQNALATTLDEKMKGVGSISEEKRDELLARASKIIGDELYPAYRQALALLEAQKPKATDAAGLSRLKGGDKAYAYYLRYFTTTNLTAEQIHEVGLKQVASLEGEMDVLLRKLGRTEGTVTERMAQLGQDSLYPDLNSEETRQQVLDDATKVVREAEKRSEELFDLKPKNRVEVKAVPTYEEKNSAPRYVPPATDGSRPGVYQYARNSTFMSKMWLPAVSYHEAVPGHHFQVALQMENKDVPRFRSTGAFGFLSAYVEGWGLYAERLAIEQGWYEDDLVGRLGALGSIMMRARRLVVDTGIHAKGWSRQQAIDYGMPVSEVERYVVMPGQACSYMIGQLKILELREKAKKELGDQFSLPEFHNVVLRTGMVPLVLLERRVDEYIAAKGGEGSRSGN